MENTVLAFTQAKASGDLIDVSEIAKEAGFEWPVAVDKSVHAAVTRQAEQGVENGLWELLFAAWLQARDLARTDEGATELEISAVVGRRRGQGVIVRAQLMVGLDETDKQPCVVLLRPPSMEHSKPAQ